MLLREIATKPRIARRYMERFLNNGSPSGFTQKYTTSSETSPFGAVAVFSLLTASLSRDLIEDFGEIPKWLCEGEIPLHPDMANEELIITNCEKVIPKNLMVAPTASGRTVEIIDPTHAGFVKLTYDRLLGRVNRQISRAHAVSAIDVTSILDQATKEKTVPSVFSFLRESGARVASLRTPAGGCYEWGSVFREIDPFPEQARTTFIIPVFSLFASDMNEPGDPPLLNQLCALQELPPEEYVFQNVLVPILTCYFELLLTCALQFECNAQNVLIGFDQRGGVTTVIFRDFESVDKDVSLAEDLKLKVSFKSSPFKCVHREFYYYSIKHSFMYDFKLGEYILSPIIATVPEETARSRLTKRTKEFGRDYVGLLPPSFFPLDGQWYSYANVVVDKTARRPYFGMPDPKYR
jgi:hypothetical protein